MQKASINIQTPQPIPEWTTERLDSWKEIGSFFRREVRTVQLWEKSEGLPVRRQYHKKLGSVYAYRRELENWWAARAARGGGFASDAEVTPGSGTAVPICDRGSRPPDSALEEGLGRIVFFPFEVLHSRRDWGPLQHTADRFMEGLQEDLLVELHREHCQAVCLSTKSLPAHGNFTAPFLRNTAREFRADFYLTGSIRYTGSEVRVCVRLMRSQDAVCLWTDRFDTTLDHVLHAQAEIAHKIAIAFPKHMIGRMARPEQNRVAEHGLAHHACMMGRHFWLQRTRADLMKALGYFQDAVLLDPQCADAYAGLADTYVSLSYNHVMPPRKALEAARLAVQSGLALAPDSLKVRNAEINFLVNCAWDWTDAERHCRAVVDSGCVDSRTLQLYASLMTNLGRHDQAIQLSLSAHRLDPLSDSVNSQVSFCYFYAGDYASALSFIDRTIELRPSFTTGYALLGRTQAERGNWDEAIQAFERGLALPSSSVFLKALLAYGHAGCGNADQANAILGEIQEGADDECFPAYDVSAVYAKLNQESEALQNIRKAYDMRDMKMTYIQHDPRFNSLRTLPQFQKITSSIFACQG